MTITKLSSTRQPPLVANRRKPRRPVRQLLALAAALLLAHSSSGVEFQSRVQASQVIELYTSEGCSSCPPADRWLSQFKESPELFTSLVPLAFHVDYWDYIGWRDPYAQAQYSARQRRYAQQGRLHSVYTPGFVVNGQEWRQWFQSHGQLPTAPSELPGILKGVLNDNLLQVSFVRAGDYTLHLAYLGLGLSSQVTAGENRSRHLAHDFVVLKQWQADSSSASPSSNTLANSPATWQLSLPAIPDFGQQQTALVIWLSKGQALTPIQATGTLLAGR
ncbi:DUF1223 domain-containing protein [Halioxenophilus sp. WMMB6]|uniref:DUF1223 domain-containing protein n=1 Tax=Halioxenophilus sp. WMMB6 TaxID=3073815 RepID=UPI00295EB6AF|nr:DUF1223 domain-containing protein [Halioxenophilus sp. WMMB6]